MDNKGTITTHNFIADYTDHTGQHFNRSFQMMGLLKTDEAQAAKNIQEHLENDGFTVYCLMCIRERLTADELQHIADNASLPGLEIGRVFLYPSKQCIKEMFPPSKERM